MFQVVVHQCPDRWYMLRSATVFDPIERPRWFVWYLVRLFATISCGPKRLGQNV